MRSPLALWSRLSAMTWDEIPTRVREQWRRQIDRAPVIPPAESLPAWPVELGLTVPQFSAVWRQADAIGALADPDWARCPVTGHVWGTGHAFDIDLFCGVDPRASWTQHRLREVQVLAVAGAAGHAKADAKAKARTLDWIRTNPPLKGLGWASGIEVASRSVSLLIVGATLATDWTPAERRELADSLAAHGWALRRYPSVGSSANNHAVAELGARVLLGEPVGEAFTQVFEAMVRPDGSGVEEAPAYLATCVEWALMVRAAGALGSDERLLAACRFLGGLVDGLGRSPALGDDDGDCVLGLDRRSFPFDAAGLAASALERPDLCPVGWSPGLRGALLAIGHCPGTRPVTTAEIGGGVARLTAGTAVAWVDRGALGMAPMAAHGHADALSVCLHLGGRPVLVDSGTGTYLGDAVWRRHARGASAHNTLVVDSTDPFDQKSPFQWATEPSDLWKRSWLADNEAGGRWAGWPGLEHERTVQLRPDALVIDDRVEGEGTRRIALPLHFAAELVLEDSLEIRFEQHVLARIEAQLPGLQIEVRRGQVAPTYGERVDAPVFWAEGDVELPWSGRVTITF